VVSRWSLQAPRTSRNGSGSARRETRFDIDADTPGWSSSRS
jgi:hypothetical protein